MEIHAIFDRQYSGHPGEAVWIIDSPANRRWFEEAKANLAPNSALFLAERYASVQMALCYMIPGIKEHFPEWQRISVSGIAPAIPVPGELLDEGRWEVRQDGFVLHRI